MTIVYVLTYLFSGMAVVLSGLSVHYTLRTIRATNRTIQATREIERLNRIRRQRLAD